MKLKTTILRAALLAAAATALPLAPAAAHPPIAAEDAKASFEQDRADILNMLTEKFGAGALAGVAGGALAGHEGTATPQVDATKAGQLTPAQVRDVAVAAQQGEPGIMDRIGNFYAEHPDLVKTLGAGALMIALARFKNNNLR